MTSRGPPFPTLAAVIIVLLGFCLAGIGASHDSLVPQAPRPPTAPNSPSPTVQEIPTIPYAHPALVPLPNVSVTVIRPNGSLTNLSAPISVAGQVYTLTGPLAGTIEDECNGTTLNGAGYLITPIYGQYAIVVVGSVAVTVEDFDLANASGGFYASDDSGLTLEHSTLRSTSWGATVDQSTNVALQDNLVSLTGGILLSGVDGVTLTSNQIVGSDYRSIDLDAGANVSARWNNISSTQYGASVYDASAVEFWGNNISANVSGIEEVDVVGTEVDWNNLTTPGTAILLEAGTGFNTTEDAGSAPQVGVDLYGESNGTVEDVSFPHATDAGIEMEGAENVTVIGGNFTHSAEDGIAVLDSSDTWIEGVNVSSYGRSGVEANYTLGLQILGTAAVLGSGNSSVAVRLLAVRNAEVSQCNLSEAGSSAVWAYAPVGLSVIGDSAWLSGTPVINVTDGEGVTIVQNHVERATGMGVDIQGSIQLNVSGNWAGSQGTPGGIGFQIEHSIGGHIAGNTVLNANVSLELSSDSSLRVIDNNLSRSTEGLEAAGDLNLTVAVNTFFEDNDSFNLSGIVASGIYHNNFVSDSGWLLNTSTSDGIQWDAGYTNGGNFWSNHTGPDLMTGPDQDTPFPGGDGIVDTPVVLNPDNIDHYPLTSRWIGYVVQFNESGILISLPLVAWSLVIDGVTYVTEGGFIVVPQSNAPDSELNYTVPYLKGYAFIEPRSGNLLEARGNFIITITYTPYLYAITFVEGGLQKGAVWSITISSTVETSNNTTIVYYRSNGAYNYLPATELTGYEIIGGAGSVSVNGSVVSQFIAFIPINPTGSSSSTSSSASAATVDSLEAGMGVAIVVALTLAVVLWQTKRSPVRPPSNDGPKAPGP
ncbi:MAG: right-handed parallel beta-helix repeat-containing protein [Thermoplasmata archaeon]|nr:right-handed parallel beta-helix repeat-containing protein [Thermoplasmata archaeon]